MRRGRRRRHGHREHRRPEPDRARVRADLGGDRPPGPARPRPPRRAAGRRPHGHGLVRPVVVGRLHARHDPRDHPDDLRRLPRPIPGPQADRRPRRRGTPLPRRPVREGRRGRAARAAPDDGAPDRLPPPDLVRLHHLRPGRAAVPRLGRRGRSRPVRHGLAAPGPRRRGVARQHGRACRRISATRSAAATRFDCSGCDWRFAIGIGLRSMG